ncbi:MAG: FAD:protein FMN transferase, partial [Deltaproteobacteria bacterium]|nr:FAD:protein FMN transferase [Deltaproteobacteria bacterium]
IVEIQALGNETDARAAMKAVAKELKRIDKKFGYHASLITDLNTSHKVKDKELYNLIQYGIEIHRISGGAFSLALRPILDAWGFSGTHPYHLPSDEEFNKWEISKNDKGIHLLDDNESVYTEEGVGIDVGGIAKGYGVDRAASIMTNMGVDTGLINAGGDIMAFGEHTWQIGIKNPRGPGVVAIIPVQNKAVATSGDYERFFINNGKRFCHILNPQTGLPARRYMSVTIIGPTCRQADAWATAVFVMGIDDTKSMLEERGLEWMVIDLSGKIKASRHLKKYCPDRITPSQQKDLNP